MEGLSLRVERIQVVDDNGCSYVLSTANQFGLKLPAKKSEQNPSAQFEFVELATGLTDDILAKAYRVLFGMDWKRGWNDDSLAREMRSILQGGDMPCRPFSRWVATIKFIEDHV